jgi:hydroxymethylpyrimidine pyrophosphatase-like HAD family hydrolase
LPDLKKPFPNFAVFDRIVAENGALVFDPRSEKEQLLAPAHPVAFVDRLVARGVAPLSLRRSIVATSEPHESTVLEVIRELDLELQIFFNKGAVMVLPAGVNKAVGLTAALHDLELSPHNVVAVGDAENDHALLNACGCAAAVANALPKIKEIANVQLARDHGPGVQELMERICREDAALAKKGAHPHRYRQRT